MGVADVLGFGTWLLLMRANKEHDTFLMWYVFPPATDGRAVVVKKWTFCGSIDRKCLQQRRLDDPITSQEISDGKKK